MEACRQAGVTRSVVADGRSRSSVSQGQDRETPGRTCQLRVSKARSSLLLEVATAQARILPNPEWASRQPVLGPFNLTSRSTTERLHQDSL